jgi:tripartite-type tricarboxylate transporter receptor subunit TctC
MEDSACTRRLTVALPQLALTAVSIVALIAVAVPSDAADFYEGKTVTVIVGYAPGGGVDAHARVVTRHLGRFIPGNPSIVIQNMEGAAGIVAANHVRTRVAPDGLTLAVPGRSWYIEAMVRRSPAMPDPTAFTYIGSPGPVSATGFIHKRTSIHSLPMLKAATSPVIFGGLGATTPTAMGPALLAAAGYPVKVVLGYVSTARVLLALEQGEINGTFTTGSGLAARVDLFHSVTPVVQTGPARPGVPLLREMVLERHKAIADLVAAPDELGLILLGPPGMPADVTAILRKAFLNMSKDKDYMADAVKVELPVGDPIEGGRLGEMMKALSGSTTGEVIAEFARVSAR